MISNESQIFRPKNKTQMPQKFLVAKKTEAGSAAKLYGSLPGITSQKTTATAEAAKYCNIEATVVQTSSEKLDLSVKPKGEIQYVRSAAFLFYSTKSVEAHTQNVVQQSMRSSNFVEDVEVLLMYHKCQWKKIVLLNRLFIFFEKLFI